MHCDLLGCVEDREDVLDFTSESVRCAVPQLVAGGLTLQTLAVACISKKGATKKTERQVELYKELLEKHRDEVASVSQFSLDSDKVHFILSIENASGLAEEDESLEKAFERFEAFASVERILYVSLTWNHENRFGGGNSAPGVGLKEDGKRFLEFLDGRGVCIDLSHTSDALAWGILNYIDKESLNVQPIASHSNSREVSDIPRNLPDELIQEIIRRNGVIGLNFIKKFVGENPNAFVDQIDHILNLGGEDSIALGADYYGGVVFSKELVAAFGKEPFFPEYDNAAKMKAFISCLSLKYSDLLIDKITHKNVIEKLLKGY